MGVRLNAPSRFQADQDSRQRTGPAAEKLEEVQRIFSRALCASLRRPFINPVHHEQQQTHPTVSGDDGDAPWYLVDCGESTQHQLLRDHYSVM